MMTQVIRHAQEATNHGWQWNIELCDNPDRVLAQSNAIVATCDSWVIDKSNFWIDLVQEVINSPDLANSWSRTFPLFDLGLCKAL